MRLSELARQIGAELIGDGNLEVNSVAPLDSAAAGQVTFLTNPKYIRQLQTTNASAAIVGKSVRSDRVAMLVAADPYYAAQQAIVALHGHRKHPFAGVHPKAHVEPTATVSEGAVIYPGCYVGPRAKIGRDSILYPNVVVYDDCIVGDRCIVHAGVSIGADGYGFATHKGVHHKIPQIGNVIIEDDVEIGPNTTISRAALQSTIIGQGTKIDQSVVVGHNVVTGPHCLFVAQLGIAGSAKIGHHVTLAGQVGVGGHLNIGNNVTVGAKSGVMQDLPDGSVVAGIPAMPFAHARRVYVTLTELPDLVRKVRELEQRLAELSSQEGEII